MSDLTRRTVLAVLAHPDDEGLACGGTLAMLSSLGHRVVLVCASRGEVGSVADAALLAGRDLASVRAQELDTAARRLGIEKVVVLEHEDGCLSWAEGLDDDLRGALARFRPDVVITFDADGLYWHPDHIALHARTTAAVAAWAADSRGAAPALYYATMPEGAMRGLVDEAHARGGAPDGVGLWGVTPDAFGVHAPPATIRMDVQPWADQKLAAIRAHETQLPQRSPFRWIEPEGARRWLGVELFRRAPGGGDTADAPPEDLLEALGERMGG